MMDSLAYNVVKCVSMHVHRVNESWKTVIHHEQLLQAHHVYY